MMLSRLSLMTQTLLLMLAGSVVPLAFALTSQYGFGLHPCEMCIYQRIPYAVVGILVLLVLYKRASARVVATILAAAVMLWVVEAGLAVYHVGIEQSWWDSATGCTSDLDASASLDDLRASIMNSPLVSCSDVSFSLLGLSMAAWNVVVAVGLVAAGWLVRKQWKVNV